MYCRSMYSKCVPIDILLLHFYIQHQRKINLCLVFQVYMAVCALCTQFIKILPGPTNLISVLLTIHFNVKPEERNKKL